MNPEIAYSGDPSRIPGNLSLSVEEIGLLLEAINTDLDSLHWKRLRRSEYMNDSEEAAIQASENERAERLRNLRVRLRTLV